MLNTIFELFNSSVFESIGINIDINNGLNNIGDGFLTDFGITTDFMSMHL